MKKSTALNICSRAGVRSLKSSNTMFSNIITAQKGWWLQPFNEKFKQEFYMVLNDDRSKNLYVFQVYPNAISSPKDHFNQRNDKYRDNCSNIYIPTDGTTFKERNGFDFTPYLVGTIKYD